MPEPTHHETINWMEASIDVANACLHARQACDEYGPVVDAGAVRAVFVVCEAIKRLEQSLYETTGVKISDRFSHAPLKTYIHMREILAHKYWSVDMDIVWDTISIDLPQLKASLPVLIETVQELHVQPPAQG
jgi:uncharacterized protein with HEPN domain